MKRLALVIGFACIAPLVCAELFGCASDQAYTAEQARATASQKYDYDYVKRQSAKLQPGLSKAEVLILLGSPAQREAARWVYLPKRSGLLIPAEALVVRFVGERYESHVTEPIVLGERFGN